MGWSEYYDGRNDKRHSDPPITIPINDMNNYFNRFDTEVCSLNCTIICQTIPYCSPQLDVVARILFLDFTSAFNTMRVDILLERFIYWVSTGAWFCGLRTLLSRTQRVWCNGQLSDECTVNTGLLKEMSYHLYYSYCILMILSFTILILNFWICRWYGFGRTSPKRWYKGYLNLWNMLRNSWAGVIIVHRY